MTRGYSAAALALVLLLSACTGATRRLDLRWVTPGSTTRQQAIEKLGQPARVLDNKHVMAWRTDYAFQAKGIFAASYYQETVSTGAVGTSAYNLILVFDNKGVLTDWKRIQIAKKEGVE